MKVVSIDFETANNNQGSVCAVGLCVLEDGVVEEAYYSLIHPPKKVDYFFGMNTRIHGIKKEDVKDAPCFEEVYQELLPYFEDAIVVAHNASFDMSCIRRACELCELPIPDIRYVDTVGLSRKIFPELPNHRLNTVSEHIECELEHHNAFSDARACLMIVVEAMNMSNTFEIEALCALLGVKIHKLYK